MKKVTMGMALILFLGLFLIVAQPGTALAGPDSVISSAIVAAGAGAKIPTKVEAHRGITITMFVIIVMVMPR